MVVLLSVFTLWSALHLLSERMYWNHEHSPYIFSAVVTRVTSCTWQCMYLVTRFCFLCSRTGESDEREQSKLEVKVWDPNSPLTDRQIDQFLVVARWVWYYWVKNIFSLYERIYMYSFKFYLFFIGHIFFLVL